MMFDVGKERIDGKYNVWRRNDSASEWILIEVFDDQEEAREWASEEKARIIKQAKGK